MPSGSGCGSLFASTPLPQGGWFFIASEKAGAPSSSLGAPPQDEEDLTPLTHNEELELGMEADDKDDSPRPEPDDNTTGTNRKELEILQGILPKGHGPKPPSMPKSGDK